MPIALDIDLYQASMLYSYFRNQEQDLPGSMESFARKLPFCRDFFVVAGLGRIIDYLADLKFTTEDIRIINEVLQIKDESFGNYLSGVDFAKQLTIYAMPEGTVAFPYEPIIRLDGPIGLCQYVEKHILGILNHDIRIASKAARIVLAAQGRPVMEFGGRRAHEACTPDAARAAYIAGFSGSSNLQAYATYGIPVTGTMGHVWIMSHNSEAEAFEKWGTVFPNSTYLVDTYDTLQGVENAIKYGKTVSAIRLDSGDLYNLSVNARRALNNSGNHTTKIVATNDLDEYSITTLLQNGAPIDSFGVGTQLVSTPDCPSFGFVHKLIEVDGRAVAKKADKAKGTWPGKKQVWRDLAPYNNSILMAQDTISTFDEAKPSDFATPMVQEYKIEKQDAKNIVWCARDWFKQTLATLPQYMKIIPKKPILQEQPGRIEYPVRFSNNLIQLRNKTNA